VIDYLAQHGNPQAVKFPFAQIKHRDRNPQNRHADDAQRVISPIVESRPLSCAM